LFAAVAGGRRTGLRCVRISPGFIKRRGKFSSGFAGCSRLLTAQLGSICCGRRKLARARLFWCWTVLAACPFVGNKATVRRVCSNDHYLAPHWNLLGEGLDSRRSRLRRRCSMSHPAPTATPRELRPALKVCRHWNTNRGQRAGPPLGSDGRSKRFSCDANTGP